MLARHGDAVGTKGKLHGLQDDPMTSAGRREIYHLATELQAYHPQAIVYSPLSRTRDSAQILSRELGIPAHPAKALLPLDLGHLVGKSTTQYADYVRHYLSHPDDPIPGGGTVNAWARAYLPFFERYLTHPNTGTIIFMTHGRNIVLSKAYLESGQPAPAFDKATLVNNQESTEHGGYAVATPGQFEVVTPKPVARGLS